MKRFPTASFLAFLCLAAWLVANAMCLTRFPPMHADEAWLASETRSILEEHSLKARADFFHITERSPHAIRLLFHTLQAPFVTASWSLASVRSLSLLCGLAVIIFTLTSTQRLFVTSAAPILFIAGLALDPLFITSSHLARPEIALCAALAGATAIYLRRPSGKLRFDLLIATIIGLSIGLHANSLLVAFGVGALYVVDLVFKPGRQDALKRLLVVVGTTALWALFWMGASRLLSPDFPRAYTEFGGKYGVGESILVKLLRMPPFYGRLFDGITGTYYLPPLRATLLLFATGAAVGFVLILVKTFTCRFESATTVAKPFAMLIAVNLGLLAIGKYSQPTAVLLLPGGYWLAAAVLDELAANRTCRYRGFSCEQRGSRVALRPPFAGMVPVTMTVLLVAAIGTISARAAAPWLAVRYDRYLERIAQHVPADTRVLAGPNTAFAFEHGMLHAINDLEALADIGISFSEYIEYFDIRYILYPDELNRIYAERPVWNDLYGNVALYHPEMLGFLAEECAEVASYDEPVFAMRILLYQQRYASRLTIYEVIR